MRVKSVAVLLTSVMPSAKMEVIVKALEFLLFFCAVAHGSNDQVDYLRSDAFYTIRTRERDCLCIAQNGRIEANGKKYGKFTLTEDNVSNCFLRVKRAGDGTIVFEDIDGFEGLFGSIKGFIWRDHEHRNNFATCFLIKPSKKKFSLGFANIDQRDRATAFLHPDASDSSLVVGQNQYLWTVEPAFKTEFLPSEGLLKVMKRLTVGGRFKNWAEIIDLCAIETQQTENLPVYQIARIGEKLIKVAEAENHLTFLPADYRVIYLKPDFPFRVRGIKGFKTVIGASYLLPTSENENDHIDCPANQLLGFEWKNTNDNTFPTFTKLQAGWIHGITESAVGSIAAVFEKALVSEETFSQSFKGEFQGGQFGFTLGEDAGHNLITLHDESTMYRHSYQLRQCVSVSSENFARGLMGLGEAHERGMSSIATSITNVADSVSELSERIERISNAWIDHTRTISEQLREQSQEWGNRADRVINLVPDTLTALKDITNTHERIARELAGESRDWRVMVNDHSHQWQRQVAVATRKLDLLQQESNQWREQFKSVQSDVRQLIVNASKYAGSAKIDLEEYAVSMRNTFNVDISITRKWFEDASTYLHHNLGNTIDQFFGRLDHSTDKLTRGLSNAARNVAVSHSLCCLQ